MRVASIDILRALTMVFMIWVNDFFTLIDVPKWLEHANGIEDYLGFSDIIFPLFLFIVGLSIPYAIEYRFQQKESKVQISKHIVVRTLSLLLIGVFMVNYETAHHESISIGKEYWELLMTLAVFLIWMQWKKSPVPKKWYRILQVFGFCIFIFLAIIYKGGENGEKWMTTQWWGILGLIGWAYVINALVYLFCNYAYRLHIMIILWLVFNLLTVLVHTDNLDINNKTIQIFSVLYSGTIPAFTTAGVVATLLFKKLNESNLKLFYGILIVLGILNIVFALITRSIWGISKIQGTPSWVAICTGIGFILFVVLHYISDVRKKVNWAKLISPAGTATLTCYMIPYFIYPLRNITGIRLPDFLNSSIIGLIVSFTIALAVVIYTGWLEKNRFKLKL